MRTAPFLTIALGLIGVASLPAQDEPKLPKTLNQPIVALGRAVVNADGTVGLRLRIVDVATVEQVMKVQVPERVRKVVNGMVVEETQLVEKEEKVPVMVPRAFREVPLTMREQGVQVQDMKGAALDGAKLAQLLSKEVPVLLSLAGPVDPFFLQTQKADTVLVLAPPMLIFPPPPMPKQ